LAWGGWYLYRASSRPSFERSGGTVLVYELDADARPDDYQPEAMIAALRRRLDPGGVAGITVRATGDTRVEIVVPRTADHDTQIRRVKDLIARAGSLEFAILANDQDDPRAQELASKYMERAERNPQGPERAALVQAWEAGKSPPAPGGDNGATPLDTTTGLGKHTYRWAEIGPSLRHDLHLDDDFGGTSTIKDGKVQFSVPQESPSQLWHLLAVARGEENLLDSQPSEDAKTVHHYELAWKAGETPDPARLQRYQALPYQGATLIYSRMVGNPALLSPGDRAKRVEYFLLVRNAEKGREVTGKYLTDAYRTMSSKNFGPAIGFRFNEAGTDRFRELTRKNAPTADGFRRQIAILLDGQIVTAPTLSGPIGADGIIEGHFTAQEVERYVTILRAGALPATLKPEPVSEVAVEPG
jgi:hypothetical protein